MYTQTTLGGVLSHGPTSQFLYCCPSVFNFVLYMYVVCLIGNAEEFSLSFSTFRDKEKENGSFWKKK